MRYANMDYARATLMIMGIFHHAALIYTPGDAWRVSSNSQSIIFSYISDFIHVFRMYSFYIVAGFFFALSIEKAPVDKVVSKRFVRLFFPLIVVGFTFNSLMNLLSTNKTFSDNLLWYLLNGEWLGHLWFIGNLLTYILIMPLFIKITRKAEFHLGSGYQSVIIALSMTTVASLTLVFMAGKLTHLLGIDAIFMITINELFYYAPFFILGFVMFDQKELFRISTSIRFSLIFLLTSIIVTLMLEMVGFNISSFKAADIMHPVYGLAAALVVLGIFNLFTKDTPQIRAISDSSYTIYLLHQPLVVLMFYPVDALGIGIYGYFIICFLTIWIAWNIHKYIVNRNELAAFLLNGKLKKNWGKQFRTIYEKKTFQRDS